MAQDSDRGLTFENHLLPMGVGATEDLGYRFPRGRPVRINAETRSARRSQARGPVIDLNVYCFFLQCYNLRARCSG